MRLLPVILIISVAQGLERRITYFKNPGCRQFNMNFYHIVADGQNDTLHYVWDFTKKPTVFIAVTNANTTLNLHCIDFVDGMPKSFNFSQSPMYEFFFTLNKLIEFNDVNDTGILTPQTPRISYDASDFHWTVVDEAKEDDEHRFVNLKIKGSEIINAENSLSGNISIQLTAFGSENHDIELPRLLHSPNSTQCTISLENLVSNSGFNQSRFAVEFILVSKDSKKSSSKIVTRKNLDDENSPGIFSVQSFGYSVAFDLPEDVLKLRTLNFLPPMVDVMTPKAQDHQFRGAYLQWRPIIYTTKVPSITNSSETVAYNLTKVTDHEEIYNQSLPFKYYGPEVESYLIEKTVVSMGVTEDGFYKNTNFTSWTFLINYGSPEDEKFSLLVILVMCIGLGLPALLIVVGGSYMCARRIRRNKDELSLER